jgi:plastocyanin
MRIRYLAVAAVLALVAAFGAATLGGSNPIQATASIINAHVHDDYFHPTTGGFNVGPGHSTAQALCTGSTPDPTCTSTIAEGDSIMWVAPAPLALNAHSVTECTNGTYSVCGAGVSAPNPIEDSGLRFQPGWPYVVQFDDPGTFFYRCELHPFSMRGSVNVVAGVGGTVELTSGDSVRASETAPDSDSTMLYAALAVAGVIGVAGIGLTARRRAKATVKSDE